MPTIYKICRVGEWNEALRSGAYRGSEIDRRDGFIHFSTASQVGETLRKHFAAVPDLVLIAVDADRLGVALRYEQARGGQLFPHLYGILDPQATLWARPLPLASDGAHQIPALA